LKKKKKKNQCYGKALTMEVNGLDFYKIQNQNCETYNLIFEHKQVYAKL